MIKSKLKYPHIYLFLSLLLITQNISLYSQNAEINLSNDSILIGEQVELKIRVSCDKKSTFDIPWNTIYDSISNKFEILNYSNIDTIVSHETSKKQITQKLTVTSWEEGMHVIYPFEFSCITDNKSEIFESEAQLVSVWLIDVDDEKHPKDIKPIISIPITLREALPWIIGVLLLLLALFIFYKYRHKLRKRPAGVVVKKLPDVPAHVYALSELESLKKKKLWQSGKVKLFYIELSTILRSYIEMRYGIMALEMTSDETLNAVLKPLSEFSNQYNNLKWILEVSDMVKFAKHNPLPDENHKCLELAFEFVNLTKEEKEEESNKTENTNSKDV